MMSHHHLDHQHHHEHEHHLHHTHTTHEHHHEHHLGHHHPTSHYRRHSTTSIPASVVYSIPHAPHFGRSQSFQEFSTLPYHNRGSTFNSVNSLGISGSRRFHHHEEHHEHHELEHHGLDHHGPEHHDHHRKASKVKSIKTEAPFNIHHPDPELVAQSAEADGAVEEGNDQGLSFESIVCCCFCSITLFTVFITFILIFFSDNAMS